MVHLAKSLAVEWVDFARVNCISPGFIETEMLGIHSAETRAIWNQLVPAKRNCEPFELKGVSYYLYRNEEQNTNLPRRMFSVHLMHHRT